MSDNSITAENCEVVESVSPELSLPPLSSPPGELDYPFKTPLQKVGYAFTVCIF
jgi:hypothetical protein